MCPSPRTLLHYVVVLALVVLATTTGLAQTFSVSAGTPSLTVYPGQTNVPVTVSAASDTYTGPINVTLSGLPTGITVSPSPLTLSAGGTGTLFLNVALNADQEAFPASSSGNANTATTPVQIVGAVGAVIASSTLNLTVSLTNPSFSPTPSQINLPIVTINTSGTPIVNGTTDVPGTITITSPDGSVSYLPNSSDADTTGTFHLHGNTTATMPKKAYHVKLNTSLDLLHQMGLNCPYVSSKGKAQCDKSKSYILLANYDDKTFLRDWSASALTNAIPYGGSYLDETPLPSGFTGAIPTPSGTATHMPWAPHSLFVELYLNGIYEGNYQLIEQIKVDSSRVNISELAETDTGAGGDDLTGGYLLEIDQHQDEAFVFKTPQGLPIGLIDPDFTPDPEIPEQTNYISNYVDNAENALYSSSFTDPVQGWRAYFDEASAINFYLVNDIMGNVDGGDFYSSNYVYKAKDNPFLYMGPIWDFDISAGNVNYEPIVNPTVPWMQTRALWYEQWFTDPGFKADVIAQFNALKNNGVLTNWISSISQQAAKLEQSQVNNYARWPMLGIKVWPNPQAAGSYDAEVNYLINFLTLRIAYLDSQFNGKTKTSITLTTPTGNQYLGTPVTLAARVTGGASPSGQVTFFSNSVAIGTASVDSTGATTLTTTLLILGTHNVFAVYNGDSSNALSSSASKNITVVPALVSTMTSLTVSAANISPTTNITLSASVVGNSGSTVPTGSVSFSVNGSIVGSAVVANGVATYGVSNLPTGTDLVAAVYSGDTAYKTSTSPSASVHVTDKGVPVTVGTIPNGLAYTVDGYSYYSEQTLSLDPGTTHTLSTSITQTYSGVQNTFAGWSDGGAQSHSITIPTSAASFTASFNTVYLLAANAAPSGFGAVATDIQSSTGYYPAGTVVTLTAIPNAGYAFSGWSGNVASATSARTTITMTGQQNVTANFVPSSNGISFGNGFSSVGLSLNGSASVIGTNLGLTNNSNQAGSAYGTAAVNVQAFTNDFTFQLPSPTSDGFTFVLQNQGLGALGASAADLGYGSGATGVQRSVAIKFDLYNNAGEGNSSTGLFTNGKRPTIPATDLTSAGVTLRSGDLFKVHMNYDGSTLSVAIMDTVTGVVATQAYTVDIPSVVGGSTAYAGFTAGTGAAISTQKILTWTFMPSVQGVASPVATPSGGTYSTAQVVSLSEATVGANIFYTLDGSTPTASSTPYAGPINIASSSVLNAIAIANGASSSIASAAYNILATPTILPASGTFSTAQQVVLTDATQGAALYYTLDGTSPTAASIPYTEPITVSNNVVVSAVAVMNGALSAPASATYTFLKAPTFSIPGGNYAAAQQLVLSSSLTAASIYFTVDGSIPTTSSTLYAGPITVGANETVSAVAVLNGTTSAVATAAYAITGASGSIDYGAGFPPGNLILNGIAALNGAVLQVATPAPSSSGAAYYQQALNVHSFTNDFTFQLPQPTSDGFTFLFQNQGTDALGGMGLDLGYGSLPATAGIQQSVAIKFDLNDDSGEGVNSTGLFTNGTRPTTPATDLTPSGVDLHSGNPMHVRMTYDGAALIVSITDTVTQATATQTYPVDIPQIVGGDTALLGFTAGTGSVGSYDNILNWTFSAPLSLAAPTISPASTAFVSSQQVTLSEAANSASVFYTLDGSAPTSSSNAYTAPFSVTSTTVVNAIAIQNGILSPVSSNTYSLLTAPVFSISAGTYNKPQQVLLSDPVASATIYYTVDGSTPTSSSAVYSGPIAVTANTVITAIAIANGVSSPSASAAYVILSVPTILPGPGTYATSQQVVLSNSSPGTSLYYTLDGTVPTAASTPYTVPFAVSTNVIVNAIAVLNGVVSSPATAALTFITPPTFSPAGGSYSSTQKVALGDSVAGASIYYTLDGSQPTSASPVYAGPLSIATSTTVNAIAVLNGVPSTLASSTYIISNPAVSLTATSASFGNQAVGVTTATQSITLTNTGQSVLSISRIALTGADISSFVTSNTCGTSVAVGAICKIGVRFVPTVTGPLSAAITLTDNAPDSPQNILLTGTGTSQPGISLSSANLAFGNQGVETAATPQVITLTNIGSSPLNITAIQLAGANAASFSASNTCGSSVPGGGSCSISVGFTPLSAGAFSASLILTNNAPGSPQTVALSGTGINPPTITLSSTSAAFGNQSVGVSSATQSITMTNNGPVALLISSIKLTGANITSYVSSNTCGTNLAVGASCKMGVRFVPTTTGPLSAAITLTDNAPNSPQVISLTGTGTALPGVSLSTTSVSFGSQGVETASASQSVTLTNTGAGPLNITSIKLSGMNPASFSTSNNCGASVAAGGTCTINVGFSPLLAGALGASITLTDNAPGSPQTIALSGTGINPPVVSLSATSASFGSQTVGVTTATQNITLTNTGPVTLLISSIKLTGANSTSYVSSNTCGASVAAGATCRIGVRFVPTTVGSLPAAITLTDNAADSSQTIQLTGSGK